VARRREKERGRSRDVAWRRKGRICIVWRVVSRTGLRHATERAARSQLVPAKSRAGEPRLRGVETRTRKERLPVEERTL